MVTRTLTLCAVLAALVATNAASSLAGASTNSRTVVVNGKPFFPLMLINQCSASDVAHANVLGINLILNESCPDISARRQLAMIGGQSQVVLPIKDSHLRGSGLVGWTYPDEPENNNWTPSSLRSSVTDPANDKLISFLTSGGGFFRAPYRDPRVAFQAYSQFAKLADVAGFDLYPLGHCQQDLSVVYDAQRMFNALAGNRPTFHQADVLRWVQDDRRPAPRRGLAGNHGRCDRHRVLHPHVHTRRQRVRCLTDVAAGDEEAHTGDHTSSGGPARKNHLVQLEQRLDQGQSPHDGDEDLHLRGERIDWADSRAAQRAPAPRRERRGRLGR
jgi:hypothetical protein